MTMGLAAEAELGVEDFRTLAAILRKEARIALSPAKQTLVRSRLGRRLRHHGLEDFGAYVRLVKEDAGERAAMVTALTTNLALLSRAAPFRPFHRRGPAGIAGSGRTAGRSNLVGRMLQRRGGLQPCHVPGRP